MSNIIDKIQLSGVTYDIGGQGGSGVSVVEVTQAEYDELPSSAKTDTSKMYVITDAQAGDLTNYYTKTETNTLLGGKADTATTYTKTEVDNAITAATSTKQDTLVSGTNIKTINNESLLGSGNINIQGGGGKAVTGGTNISVTTGETADTINCTLPITADTDGSVNKLLVGTGNTRQYTKSNIVIGDDNYTYGQNDSRVYTGATIIGYSNEVGTNGIQDDNNDWSIVIGRRNKINGGNTYIIGVDNNFKDNWSLKKNYAYVFGRANSGNSLTSDSQNIFVFGAYNKVTKSDEFALGKYNVSSNDGTTSGNTFFAIGNGTADNARHNAFEIRQNGDIYISYNGNDIKLQDHLGGGGGGGISSAECQTMIDNSISGKADSDDVYTTGQTSGATELATAFAATQPKLSAGTGISIDANNVISATGGGGGLTEDDELLLSTALTDLNDRKIDASEVKSNYQKKGDYATKDYVASALEPYETKLDEINTEEVTAYALNELNERLIALETAVQALQALHNNE